MWNPHQVHYYLKAEFSLSFHYTFDYTFIISPDGEFLPNSLYSFLYHLLKVGR